MDPGQGHLLALLPDGKQVPLTGEAGKDNAWYRKTLSELLDLLAAGQLKPVVAERFPLTEAARAYERIERGRYAGKVVITVEHRQEPT